MPASARHKDGDFENEVVRKFGMPSSSKIVGVAKTIVYEKLNVELTLSQESVYMIDVYGTAD